ncbi:MAG: hypothetical protein ACOX8K_00660 [Lachnospiraceae bacterium]|jgi:hypothetical protein
MKKEAKPVCIISFSGRKMDPVKTSEHLFRTITEEILFFFASPISKSSWSIKFL